LQNVLYLDISGSRVTIVKRSSSRQESIATNATILTSV